MLSFLGICATLVLLSTGAIGIHGKPRQTKPGCRYEGRRYQEGAPVNTSEPCLQCRCADGSLRCRLRVCPRLPGPSSPPPPPPPGCHVRPPGENVCCPELACGESYEAEEDAVLQRSGAGDRIDDDDDDDGCSYEGVWYGPGSAMMGAQRCEYCYCISGARRCVRPKCLLPLPGCVPLYAPHSCCPVAYNCSTHPADPSTTVPSVPTVSANGCRVGERLYQEGEMVRGDAERRATCDNCFCAMGAVRCVPLACAPPLEGCSPIVGKGHCCPSTYNCSAGSIEVKATRNYASYAFISKDYAKFRKETNFSVADDSAEGRGYRVAVPDKTLNVSTGSEPPSTVTLDSEEALPDDSSSTSTLDSEIASEATEAAAGADSTSTEDYEITTWADYLDPAVASSATFTTIDVTLTEDASTVPAPAAAAAADSAEPPTTALVEEGATQMRRHPSVTGLPTTILVPDDISVMNVTVRSNVSVGHIQGVTIDPVRSISPDVEAILNITHRRKGEDYDYDYSEPTLPPSLPNVRIIPFVAADALVKNVKDVTGYPLGSVGVAPPDSSGFYDIVTRENRFSPPIETEGGFVPREPPYFDAPHRSTDLSLEIGTGATVLPAATIANPREKDDEARSSCPFENRQYRHGQLLPSSGLCVICICHYGEVVCAPGERCLPSKIGCRRIDSETVVCVDRAESPTVVLDRADDDVGTVPSERRQPITRASPDPFRDVIRTEPAPDLPSLIEDTIPHLVESPPTIDGYGPYEALLGTSNDGSAFGYDERNSTAADYGALRAPMTVANNDDGSGATQTEREPSTTYEVVDQGSIFSIDSVLHLLFSATTTAKSKLVDASPGRDRPKVDDSVPTMQTTDASSSRTNVPENDEASTTAAIVSPLKLAGCNIYGRMYRVGRIIAELSGPCLQCRCTEIGVECKQLECRSR